MPTIELSRREQLALRRFASEEGRRWKARLRAMWEESYYPGYEDITDILQSLRNASYFEPDGLMIVRKEDIT